MDIDREKISQLSFGTKIGIVGIVTTTVNSYLMTIDASAIYLWPLTILVISLTALLTVKADPFYSDLKKEGIVPKNRGRREALRYILWRRPLRKKILQKVQKHRDLFARAAPQNEDKRIQEAYDEICEVLQEQDIELTDAQKLRLQNRIKEEWKRMREENS